MLETIEINPNNNPANASVIWLHGLGTSGNDFVDIIPEMCFPKNLAIRFIFPHAPFRQVTFAHKTPMRAWFDIAGLDESTANYDEAGIYESQRLIDELIEQEIERGIPSDKIVLAGFSQGGSIALHTGLRYPKKLAGILALSTFLPLANKLALEKNIANQNTKIAMFHGNEDHVIAINWAKKSHENLKALGFQVEWHVYSMHHTVCIEEIKAIEQWLIAILENM